MKVRQSRASFATLTIFISISLFVIFSPLMCGFGCHDVDELSPAETPCYTGPENTLNVGACRPGIPVFNDSTPPSVTSCAGEILPTFEMCNGVDDDCDGEVDENVRDGLYLQECTDGLFDAKILLDESTCEMGLFLCVDGAIKCVGAVGPQEEVCDGEFDEDCNGLVDDVVPSSTCYARSLVELTWPRSACRAGVLVCVRGELECVGQVLPSPEVCEPTGAQQIDNDCDGRIDDPTMPQSTLPDVDVVLVIDRSGSMVDVIGAVRNALILFLEEIQTSTEANARYRFALIDVPGPLEDEPYLETHLVETGLILPSISILDAQYGGFEPSYDAMIYSVDDTFFMRWRSGARHVILYFGDEIGQSKDGYLEDQVAYQMVRTNTTVHAFLPPYQDVRSTYDAIVSQSGGLIWSLDFTSSSLREILEQIITQTCQ